MSTVNTWKLAYDGFDPEEEQLREALTSTGNGYFCTRGSFAWSETDEEVHYPGTYAHGVYNRETTIMAGVPVLNEDLVNLPNWLLLELRIEGEEAIRMDTVELISYRHELDLYGGVLKRYLRFRDRAERETTLETSRFVSMSNPNRAGMQWSITPENWSGNVEVVTALDGRVLNRGVARYQDLEGRHLDPVSTHTSSPSFAESDSDDVIALEVRTRQSRIYIAEAARTRVFGEGSVNTKRSLYRMEDYVHEVLGFEVEQGKTTRVEKMISFYTSRDKAISEPISDAMRSIGRCGTFAETLERHERALASLWRECDVRTPADDQVQQLLRVHVYHILGVCSPHTADMDAGVPARGLNGEAYRGHIFWDELYIFPFLNFRLPEVTRTFLMYRYRRLNEARAAARESGHRGAMYPWQSGSNGSEETQSVHLNPESGKWDPDLSRNQRHIGADIFYNIYKYYQASGDFEFLKEYGAEMMLEIARFWASIAHYNPDRDRYEIHGVMGPDEFHEKYPGAEEGGLNNNAFTNVLVSWLFETAREILDVVPSRNRDSLRDALGITDEELDTWDEMSRKMFVPFHEDTEGGTVISQFEGYEDLEELDWEHYRKEYDKIQRLDRILKAEGDDPDRYKLSKQADVLMLFYLFSREELKEIFERLGYGLDAETAKRNADYYAARTSHGSTLSFVVHAHVLADLDLDASWDMYMTALGSDVNDVQGGTTGEAIHLGVMAGTLDLIQSGYLGCEIRDGGLYFDPNPPEKLDGLNFPILFRGVPMEVSLSGEELSIAVQDEDQDQSVKVSVGDETQEIRAGESHAFGISASVR